MKSIPGIKARMKEVADQCARCPDPVARAKLEVRFSRLMTELKRKQRLASQKEARKAAALSGPRAKARAKKVNILVKARSRAGFFNVQPKFVRGGTMSKK